MDSRYRMVNAEEFARVRNMTKVINKLKVKKGKSYIIVSPSNGNILTYKCLKPGILIVRYMKSGYKDIIFCDGTARMSFEKEISDGFNYGSFM